MNGFASLTRYFRLDGDSPETWERRFYFLLGILFLWRLLYTVIAPLDLVPDEAYYWDWSRRLDWGYYSKPPMIAWIIALSTRALGSSAFTVRLPAVILSTLGLWGLYILARRLYDRKTAFWTAAAAAASPGSSAIGLIMTIDAPLVCSWCLALYTAWRAIEEDGKSHSSRWWLLTAVCVACGALSKQMMLVFPLLLALYSFSGREGRDMLRRPWFYVMVLLSLSALLPDVWWNFQHDWITVRHTAHHFAPSQQKSSFFFLVTLFDYLGSQMLIISPMTCFLFAAVSFTLFLQFPGQDKKVRYLLTFSVLSLSVFVLMSLRQRINPNWPAAFYPAGIVLLAAWSCNAVSTGTWLDEWRRFFRTGVGIGVGFAVLTYALPFFLAAAGLDGGALDPAARMRGWQQLGRDVGAILEAHKAEKQTFLMAADRQLTSELAFYVPGQPQVFKWRYSRNIVDSQYDLWPGPDDKIGWDALILLQADQKLGAKLVASFESVTLLRGITLSRGQAGQRQYNMYLGRTLKQSWP